MTAMFRALAVGALAVGLLAGPAEASAQAGLRSRGGPMALADSVVVEKGAHKMTLYHLGRAIHAYRVALGGNPVGDKVSAGDRRTPEGLFFIDARNPFSEFHLSLHISYPDARHRSRAEQLGVSPGGDIMIHGLPAGRHQVGSMHRIADWTNGCVALTDEEMEEIWAAVPIGTPVHIKS